MGLFRGIAAALAWALSGAVASAQDADVAFPYETVFEAWTDIVALDGAVIRPGAGVTQVEVESDRTLYFFTNPGHAAHPAVVRRRMLRRDDQVVVETEMVAEGDRIAAESWLTDFAVQDAAFQERLAYRRLLEETPVLRH